MKLICVGKLKEKYWVDAVNEYSKRLGGFTKWEIFEVKEYNDRGTQNLALEGAEIISRIQKNDYVITLELDGLQLDSIQLSDKINSLLGFESIVFVIGGSLGLSPEVKSRSNLSLSFSKLTFPHQMMRVIVCEQIYRAFTILKNKEYHK